MQACMANHTILARDLFSFSKIINDLMDAATYCDLDHETFSSIYYFMVPGTISTCVSHANMGYCYQILVLNKAAVTLELVGCFSLLNILVGCLKLDRCHACKTVGGCWHTHSSCNLQVHVAPTINKTVTRTFFYCCMFIVQGHI